MKISQARRASALIVVAIGFVLEAAAWGDISPGQQIGVDVGTAYGVATNWTQFTAVNGSSVNALDLNTATTIPGVSVSLAGASASAVNDLGGTAVGNSITNAPHVVTDDGAWSVGPAGQAGTITLKFSGLDTTLAYKLEVYSLGVNDTTDTPFINGKAASWPAGFETRAARKAKSTGGIFTGLTAATNRTLTFTILHTNNPVISGAILTAMTPTSEAVNTAQWNKTVKLRFGGYQGAGALSNFPALVVLNPGTISGFSYSDFAPQGTDLRFSDASNRIVLAHEIESWNTNGISYVWVQVPTLTSNTMIQTYWGNPTATSGSTNQVWDSGFRGVWHLGVGLGDATTNRNSGVNTGSSAVAGRIGDGRSFDGSDYVDCGNSASLNPTNNQLTLSAWINPTLLAGNAIVSKSYYSTHTDPYYTWILYAYSGGLHCRLDGTTITAGALSLGQWQHVAATYDGSFIRLYVNGVQTGSTPKTGNLQATTRNVRIGGRDTSSLGEYYYGALDEVRVSAVARSADWIRAEQDTVAANASFCTYGTVEFIRPTLPLVTNPQGATNILTTTATLTGMLQSTGGDPTTVWFCWGNAEAGTSFASWNSRTNLGLQSAGAFSCVVTGLVVDVP